MTSTKLYRFHMHVNDFEIFKYTIEEPPKVFFLQHRNHQTYAEARMTDEEVTASKLRFDFPFFVCKSEE